MTAACRETPQVRLDLIARLRREGKISDVDAKQMRLSVLADLAHDYGTSLNDRLAIVDERLRAYTISAEEAAQLRRTILAGGY